MIYEIARSKRCPHSDPDWLNCTAKLQKISLSTHYSQGTRWYESQYIKARKKKQISINSLPITEAWNYGEIKNSMSIKSSDKQVKKDFIARNKKGSLAFLLLRQHLKQIHHYNLYDAIINWSNSTNPQLKVDK